MDAARKPSPRDHDALRKLELTAILGKMSDKGRQDAEKSLWGLALSGGGIRSATFALGVLQALAECKWLSGFHYVSTVSGGGYIGAYLQGLVTQRGLDGAMEELAPRGEQKKDPTGDGGRTLRRLRAYSNYLTPNKAGLSRDRISLVTTYLSNMLLTQLQLIPALLFLTLLPLLLYIAVARLATTPWMTWSMAAVAIFLAMLMRGHIQRLGQRNRRRDDVHVEVEVPELLRIAPAMLISATMLLLATLVWGAGECAGSSDVWCERWAKLAKDGERLGLLSWPARDVSRLVPAIGVAGVYFIGFVTWLIGWMQRQGSSEVLIPGFLWQLFIGLVTTAGMIPLVYFTSQWIPLLADGGQPLLLRSGESLAGRELGPHVWTLLMMGAPLLLLLFFVVSLVQIGLASALAPDQVARERWARLMGQCALWVVLAVSLPASLVAVGPWLMHTVAQSIGAGPLRFDWLVPLASIAVSAIGARSAYFEQTVPGARGSAWGERLRSIFVKAAPYAFVLGVLLLSTLAAEWLLIRVLGQAPASAAEWDLKWLMHQGLFAPPMFQLVQAMPHQAMPLDGHLLWLHQALFVPPWQRMFWMLLAIAFWWFAFAKCVDENEFSMNGFYRNRLVRCYLGATRDIRRADPDTGLDPMGDDPQLKDLYLKGREDPGNSDGGQRPLYPLICAAANLTAQPAQDWQDRKAASFVFSPLFCGHFALVRAAARSIGDRPTRDVWHNDLLPKDLPEHELSCLVESMTLGTAVSISGAAVSPNMGYHSSPALAFLLTLFNVRLGWWIENHNVRRGLLGMVGSKLLSELLSRSGDRARYTYVSDGGHFENLGIYELVRRRCRFIMSVDATADPDRDFEGLGNAIHKCRVDLHARIDIDVSLMRPNDKGISRRSAALGKIIYEDGSDGLLLYIKPSLLGNEPADVAHYASARAEFPHQPTLDQFFDEQQFEAYRELGQATGRRVFNKTQERRVKPQECQVSARAKGYSKGDGRLRLRGDDERKEELLLELQHWLYEPSNATSLRFTRHGAALSCLLDRQRRTIALKWLDDQLNPGWEQVGGVVPWKAGAECRDLPPDSDFRECFYFVQELIQLMESVYLDLDLERNLQHPDNRGWINLFRQWTWTPMFQLAWLISAQTRGARFVRFCETHLDLPRLTDALELTWQHKKTSGLSLSLEAQGLFEQRKISFIEREILQSEAVERCKEQQWVLGFLRLDWTKVRVRPLTGGELNLGIVLAVGSGTKDPHSLAVARVQDHVRRMGIGAQLVYLAVQEFQSLKQADVTPGHYGPTIGVLGTVTAGKQNSELQEMLNRARRRHGFDLEV